MVSTLHKELEGNVEKLSVMKLEVMQWKSKKKSELPSSEWTILDQSTWSVTVVIN